MRDYLILVGNLIQFVGSFTFLGICAAFDSGGTPWYGASKGAAIGILFGLVFGIGMQDRGRSQRGRRKTQSIGLDYVTTPDNSLS